MRMSRTCSIILVPGAAGQVEGRSRPQGHLDVLKKSSITTAALRLFIGWKKRDGQIILISPTVRFERDSVKIIKISLEHLLF